MSYKDWDWEIKSNWKLIIFEQIIFFYEKKISCKVISKKWWNKKTTIINFD